MLHNQGVCYIYLKQFTKVGEGRERERGREGGESARYGIYWYLLPAPQAVEKFNAALGISPQAVTYTQLGRVQLMRGDINGAVEVYRKAIK